MAITYTKRLGSASKSTGSATTYAVTTTGGASAAGALLVVLVVARSTATVTGCSDSAGNTYTVDAQAAAASHPRIALCSCRGALALPNGGTVTVTFASAQTIAAMLVDEYDGLAAAATDRTATGTATGTALATAATAATSQADELVLGAFGVDIDATGTIPTVAAGAGFTRTLEVSSPSSTLRVGVYPEHKVTSATGTQVADGTLSVSKVWAAVVATYRGGAVVPPASARRPPPTVIA